MNPPGRAIVSIKFYSPSLLHTNEMGKQIKRAVNAIWVGKIANRALHTCALRICIVKPYSIALPNPHGTAIIGSKNAFEAFGAGKIGTIVIFPCPLVICFIKPDGFTIACSNKVAAKIKYPREVIVTFKIPLRQICPLLSFFQCIKFYLVCLLHSQNIGIDIKNVDAL